MKTWTALCAHMRQRLDMRRTPRWLVIGAAAAGAGLLQPALGHAQSFDGLGDLTGGTFWSQAEGISSFGWVVVGRSISANGTEAFRWTPATGMVGLGDLPGGAFSSIAHGVSANGLVVVGQGSSAGGNEAFRWTQADGMVGLGDLPGGVFSSQAYAVSFDGSVVVGGGVSASGDEAFRWTQAGGMVGLGDLAGGWFFSNARAVSADGSVVVGQSYSASGYEAFRWTQAGGMIGLGDLPGGSFSSSAMGVSADGSVVVGYSSSTNGTEAFRWTQAGGMIGLGDLPGGVFVSQANAVNSDGSVVVGRGISASGIEAFRWTQSDGIQSVRDLLVAAGVDMTGWSLTSANAITADGYTIVGAGTDPNAKTQAWIARFVRDPAAVGLITPAAAAQSVAGLSVLTEGASSWLDNTLATQSEIARHHRCERGPSSGTPFCGFAYFEGGAYHDRERAAGNGTLGIKAEAGGGWSASVSVRGGHTGTELGWDGSGDLPLTSANAFVALVPETGPRIVLAGTAAYLGGNVKRGYMNGAGTAISMGDTSGNGVAGGVRGGWAFAPGAGYLLTPYAEYSYAHVTIDGWTETGGPFPAAIAGLTDTAQRTRLGAEGRVMIGAASWVWGALAWGHRFDGRAAAVDGYLLDLFAVSAPGAVLERDWAEVTAGARAPVTEMSAITASVTAQVFAHGAPSVQGRAGYSHRF